MLRNRKSSSGLSLLIILAFLSGVPSWGVKASDDIPIGFKADRYQQVWERNPFTLVTPVAVQAKPNAFDKLILLSWLNDGGKDVVFVQNIETNEVQKITAEANSNSLRLLAVHKAADPKLAEVVLSNGTEEGSVKFRLEVAVPPPQNVAQPGMPAVGVQNPPPAGMAPAVMSRQAQAVQNGQLAAPGAALPPRASEVRRKRITPPPVVEQPVGQPAPVPAPVQNGPNPIQPQTQ